MAVPSASGSTGSRPRTSRALQVTLRLFAMLVFAQAVFAQAVFAGLFLDGKATWRDWHAVNGMLVLPSLALVVVVLAALMWRAGHGPGWLALASVGLFLAIFVQAGMGQTSRLAVHVPLGVAILGLVGALLPRTRDLARGVPGLPAPGDDPADAGDHRRHRHPAR